MPGKGQNRYFYQKRKKEKVKKMSDKSVSTEETKNNKKWLWILLGILGVLVVAFLIWRTFSSYKAPTTPTAVAGCSSEQWKDPNNQILVFNDQQLSPDGKWQCVSVSPTEFKWVVYVPTSTPVVITAEAPIIATTEAPVVATEAPAPTSTLASTATAILTPESTVQSVASDNNIIVNDVVMGVVDPQMQQVHAAALYLPTGISGHNTWKIQIPSNGVLIVGGVSVNGVDGGVYKAWTGNQTVTIDVTNGFALVTLDKWSNWEFCFRVGQAAQYGWAHNTVSPITGWTPCQ